MANAYAATADGGPVALYARLRGVTIPGRVPGPGLLARSCMRSRPASTGVFLVSNVDTGSG